MLTIAEIETKIKKLPDSAVSEVNDFVEYLLQKYKTLKINNGNFSFDWQGDLSGLQKKYTSVELQHKAMDWR
jgi:hypothetical protein